MHRRGNGSRAGARGGGDFQARDGCDAQYLFSCDILGQNTGHVPRHAKVYATLHAELERIQRLRVEGYTGYKKDVDGGTFATDANTVPIPDAEFDQFLNQLD